MIEFIIAHWPFFTALVFFIFAIFAFCQKDPLEDCAFLQWFKAIWLIGSLIVIITYWIPSWIIIAVSVYAYFHFFLKWVHKPNKI